MKRLQSMCCALFRYIFWLYFAIRDDTHELSPHRRAIFPGAVGWGIFSVAFLLVFLLMWVIFPQAAARVFEPAFPWVLIFFVFLYFGNGSFYRWTR